MGYSYRCSLRKCRARRTLKKLITEYVERPLCPACNKDSLKPTYEAEYKRGLKRKCMCRGARWIHVPGKVIDAEHTCIHAKIEDVALAEEVDELGGGKITKMKKSDEVPF